MWIFTVSCLCVSLAFPIALSLVSCLPFFHLLAFLCSLPPLSLTIAALTLLSITYKLHPIPAFIDQSLNCWEFLTKAT